MDDKKIMPRDDTNYEFRLLPKETKPGFFAKLFPFFKNSSSQVSLVGRIHRQLQKDAHHIILQLRNLREVLKNELVGHDDQHLWASFEAIVNPLLREYDQLEKKLREDPQPITLKSYNNWIEKAKLWVALSALPHDREGITKAVVEHTQQVSDMIIDRDIKMLEEYLLDKLQLLDPEKAKIEAVKLQIEISPHINGLLALKHNKPNDLDIHSLQIWKTRINQERGKHYNAALQIIDLHLQDKTPLPEEEHDHLRDIFILVDYLEEEIPTFLEELKRSNLDDKTQISLFEDHAIYLEEQIHKLNQDLRLTPELFDRVQVMMMDLSEVRKILRTQ